MLAATGQDFTDYDPDFVLTPAETSQLPLKAPRKDTPRRTPRKRKIKGVQKIENTPGKGAEETEASQHEQDLASNPDEQVGTRITYFASHTNTINAFQARITSLTNALLPLVLPPPAPLSIARSLVSEAMRQADVTDEDESSDSYAGLLRMIAHYCRR